ncbi:DMT family transporter [Pleionea litopenaei]|uniref:DMT family transporter n=1 Tax=Pleionea litopenaei TaxID=3070815 RepID=A0AA51X6N1_9GAMM|nr:DMT family transporter [Pleionea sp. HL-JVS1]WMS87011.1 DMT family transporter [Pleionea sp. HL-JVS1]
MKPSESVNQTIHYKLTTLLMVVVALLAFAANSVLCRLALGSDSIDAASFTIIRLLSGAALLFVLAQFLNKPEKPKHLILRPLKSRKLWIAPLMLFCYALLFSLAYQTLTTATGALILFVTVQLTMVGYQLYKGNQLNQLEWFGIAISLTGLILLLLPGLAQPSLLGTLMMIGSGIAWAIYTLDGKQSQSPLRDTAENFVGTIPLCIALFIVTVWFAELSLSGMLWAVASGALASGLGYAVWYFVLPRLSVPSAAVSQLSVPLLAMFGGVVVVNEPVSFGLMTAGALILGGIALVSLAPKSIKAESKSS